MDADLGDLRYEPTLCKRSRSGREADWVRLYTESFPEQERAPVKTLRREIASGKRQLHRTLDKNRRLLCFSLIYTDFDDFVWLSYIATYSESRSQGIGSKHLQCLLQILESEFKGRSALVLEVESPLVPALDAALISARKRRLDFYIRHNARRMPEGTCYVMPNFAPGTAPIAAELLWFELTGAAGQINLAEVIPQIYQRIYGLAFNDPLIMEVAGQFAS
jgi:hypothetical protein